MGELEVKMTKIIEKNVSEILKNDGINNIILDTCNKRVVNIGKIIKKIKETCSETIINSESNSATLICQKKGEGNRLHYHPTWNEWWYIIQGKWKIEIEKEIIIVKKDDIVFIEKNKKHKITAIGDKLSIRLAVSRYDVEHIYEN